jgi:hypothetical protein
MGKNGAPLAERHFLFDIAGLLGYPFRRVKNISRVPFAVKLKED